MAQPKGTHFVVSAADTDSGAPVYMRFDGSWTRSLAEATAVESEAQRDSMIATALEQERAVCDPYAFNVVVEEGRPTALSVRERIRAQGPSTPIRRPD